MEPSNIPSSGLRHLTGPMIGGDIYAIQDLTREALASCSLVGQLPPCPPTLRGRIGRSLVRFVQRALFWYTPAVNAHNHLVVRVLNELTTAMLDLNTWVDHLSCDLENEREERCELVRRAAQLQEALEREKQANRALEAHVQALQGKMESSTASVEGLHELRTELGCSVSQGRDQVQHLREDLQVEIGSLQSLFWDVQDVLSATEETLTAEIRRLRTDLADLQKEIEAMRGTNLAARTAVAGPRLREPEA